MKRQEEKSAVCEAMVLDWKKVVFPLQVGGETLLSWRSSKILRSCLQVRKESESKYFIHPNLGNSGKMERGIDMRISAALAEMC